MHPGLDRFNLLGITTFAQIHRKGPPRFTQNKIAVVLSRVAKMVKLSYWCQSDSMEIGDLNVRRGLKVTPCESATLG